MIRRDTTILILVCGFLLIVGLTTATAQTTERVSVATAGQQGNAFGRAGQASWSVSEDGRFVTFWSNATNLVPGDSNGTADVFVRDGSARATERVSVDSAGGQAFSPSYVTAISADGRWVAFMSLASSLVPGDTNAEWDVFVRDRPTGTTTRVSVDSAGGQGDSTSSEPSISGDGRFTAFESRAGNLVADDTNGVADIFVHDRETGITERVSVDFAGGQGDLESHDAAISADGRYVAFTSYATNLVPGDTNDAGDVFVHDRQTGITELVSVDSAGGQGNSSSMFPSISADGRYVAFESFATNLVPGDTNGWEDLFVHDRQTGITERVSVDSAGGEGNAASHDPSLSAQGRFVAFWSFATNLVPDDTNDEHDVFVRDRLTGVTTRMSVAVDGGNANGSSFYPSISPDGQHIAFASGATNLVAGDTNGVNDIFIRGPVEGYLFCDGFESGETSAWSLAGP